MLRCIHQREKIFGDLVLTVGFFCVIKEIVNDYKYLVQGKKEKSKTILV